ncbi:MAG: hypothetical protein HY545_01230 [Candidatus Doudnabacteria bacterium]|nr:hypothetical protein [Candidatus Doudnabacteria bacterium]
MLHYVNSGVPKALAVFFAVTWLGAPVASGQVMRPGLPRSRPFARPPAFLNLEEVPFELVGLEPAPGQSLGGALKEYFVQSISYRGGPTFSHHPRFWERVIPLIMEDNGINDARELLSRSRSRLWMRPVKVRQILENRVADRGAFYLALDGRAKVQIEALLSRARGVPVQIRINPEGEELLGSPDVRLRRRIIFNVVLFSVTFFGTRAIISALGQERGTF